jgi:hypothetical protein
MVWEDVARGVRSCHSQLDIGNARVRTIYHPTTTSNIESGKTHSNQHIPFQNGILGE